MKKRNKEQTKQKLLNAVAQIILDKGFQGIGINSVAKTAGVDKVLIYRYFGGLNGLLKTYILEEDFASQLDMLLKSDYVIGDKEDLKSTLKELLIGRLRYLQENEDLQEILLWELHEQNEVTKEAVRIREEQSVKLFDGLLENVDVSRVDIQAVINLMTAGIYYLVLRSRTADEFGGISIQSRFGWMRLERAVSFLIDLTADAAFAED